MASSRGKTSKYKGVCNPNAGNWRSEIRVSPEQPQTYEPRYLPDIASLARSSQIGSKTRNLGTYELEEDAARAHDKVARILGRSGLNFPNSDALEITGPRSEGADKAVAGAVEAARSFVAAGGHNQSSIYIGVSTVKSRKTNPWQSHIWVSSKNCGVHLTNRHTCTHALIHPHAHTHTRSSTKSNTTWEITHLRQMRPRHGTWLRQSSGIVSTSRSLEKSRARGPWVRSRQWRTPSRRPMLLC